jgi:Methyltransferase domain
MDRLIAIKTLMKQRRYKNYLEIGVSNGHIFFRVKTSFKIAVDPCFQFGTGRIITKTLINPWNLYNKYFRVTSDDFFLKDAAKVIGGKKIDLAFIDGMHEYEYALRDIENCLKYLDDDGVILVHDCNPLTKDAARPYKEFEVDNKVNALWNGDVWKAILEMRCRKDLTTFVLDCDHGLGVITKGKPASTLNYSKSEIEKMSYEAFDSNRASFLNLKDPDYFYEFFKV